MTSIPSVIPHLPTASFQRPAQGANKANSVSADSKPEQGNPAKSAQAALAARPDLASKPFGSIVSLFAHGLPLPPVESNSDEVPPAVDTTISAPNSDAGPAADTTSA